MAQTTLRTIASVSAILLLLSAELQTAESGEQCETNSDCNEGSCVDGTCQSTDLSTGLIECGDTYCMPGEKCEYAMVKCKEGAVCPKPPPKCFPAGDVCGNITCKPEEMCFTIKISCLEGAECVTPPPKCLPRPDPCEDINCGDGYECLTSENDPNDYECKIKDLCPTTECKPNYECRMQVIYCIRAPCPPPKPVCFPIDPCKPSACPDGYDCQPLEEDPTTADCVLPDPCATIDCKDKYHCETVAVNCLVAPCPPSYGQCVPDNPCAVTLCLEGTVCTQTEDDPTVAECVLTPCATVRCGYNTTCQAYTDYCVSPPCPRPRAACVANPCASNPCPTDSYCTSDNDNALCTPIPSCDDVYCDTNEECELDVYPCLYPPCPTVAKCVCKT